jgi:dephospho-CoA kinase
VDPLSPAGLAARAAALPAREVADGQVRTIGLTGGIGSGKSTVAALLVGLGATLVDTDAIAHALTGPGGAAMPALRAAFGETIATADGALDRAAMRARVFADAADKRRLEALLHPLIHAQALDQALQALRDPGAVVVFDVPLLAESGPDGPWRRRCQRVLVIDCDEAEQRRRVMARNGWNEEQVQRIIDAQAPRAVRRALADAVLLNQGIDKSALMDQLLTIWQRWCGGNRPRV